MSKDMKKNASACPYGKVVNDDMGFRDIGKWGTVNKPPWFKILGHNRRNDELMEEVLNALVEVLNDKRRKISKRWK